MKEVSWIQLIVICIIALGMTFCMPSAEARTGVIVYPVIDQEVSMRLVVKYKDTTRNLMCLITPEGHGYTGDPRWVGLTCAVMGVEPLVWQFCRGTAGKPSLLCVTPDTKINGIVEDADPGNLPITRMNPGDIRRQ